MKKRHSITCCAFLVFIIQACDPTPSTDQIQRRETEQIIQEALEKVGMPEISNFTERALLKEILEKRDQMFPTFTYYIDRDGGKHLLCESVGYGLPASSQYSNPTKLVVQGGSIHGTLPQPAPNGLYMSAETEATYVLCSTGNGVEFVYAEPELIVSPYPLE